MNKVYKEIRKKTKRALRSINFICNHPLTKGYQITALKRYFLFHMTQIIHNKLTIYPFIQNIRFVGQRGMAGIVGNIYTGLRDFEEMGFLLHFLRKDDLFVDVGANVGAYTLLSSGVCKTPTIAIEPIPSTVDYLLLNLRLNGLNSVEVVNYGIGSTCSELYFTHTQDVLNRIVLYPNEYSQDLIMVKVFPLDDILKERKPTLIKIDVEGYEYEVIRGATKTIRNVALQAIIIEMQGHEKRFEHGYEDVHSILIENGFFPIVYDPFNRTLTLKDSFNVEKDNTIYIRDTVFVQKRIKDAPSFKMLNKTI